MKQSPFEKAIAACVKRSWNKKVSRITQYAVVKVDGKWSVFKAVVTKTRRPVYEED